MSTALRRILVVARTPGLVRDLFAWLGEEGHELIVVTSFPDAKACLELRPDVLITEVRLREYNGLHLALRAQVSGIPSVVIGEHDAVLARDTAQLGGVYMTPAAASREGMLDVVESLLGTFARPNVPNSTLLVPATESMPAGDVLREFSPVNVPVHSGSGRTVLH